MLFYAFLIIISVGLTVGVFVYSYKQNRGVKRPKVDFIREFFNHFGDGVNMKR